MDKKLLLSAFLGVVSFSAAQAAIVGNVSPKSGAHYIEVGESSVQAGPHTSGKAGIGVSTFPKKGASAKIDLQGLANLVTRYNVGGTTVYHFSQASSHAGLGTFDFIKVGNMDVWFGEWSSNGQAGHWDSRQAFYVGDTARTTVPASGSATYAVKGINKFNGNNLLSGTFRVNYNSRELTGTISNSALTIKLGNNVRYNPGSAQFTGDATAKETANPNNPSSGSVEGRFFGANAAGLAGLATFGSAPKFNTAFGGTKR